MDQQASIVPTEAWPVTKMWNAGVAKSEQGLSSKQGRSDSPRQDQETHGMDELYGWSVCHWVTD